VFVMQSGADLFFLVLVHKAIKLARILL